MTSSIGSMIGIAFKEGLVLDSSLSIILPVRNAEKQLAQRVGQLVEIVSDLTHDIEILIVDGGSTDSTEDVAMELCRTYPQLDFLRHTTSGLAGAVQAGIDQTKGEIILIHPMDASLSDDAVRRLWTLRADEELVIARSEDRQPPGQFSERFTIGPCTQLLRRKAINELGPSLSPTRIIDRVTRTDLGATPRPGSNFQPTTGGLATPPDH